MTTFDLPVVRARTRLPTATRILCVLFFFSGFPALIYQLTWQRELFRIFGVNSESVTIVVTAFMLGLGLAVLPVAGCRSSPASACCLCWRRSK